MAENGKSKKKQNRVRRDDEVYILSGEFAGRNGKVMQINRAADRVEVEIPGMNEDDKIQKHMKRSNEFPNGAILKLNPTIHISNVMKLDVWNERPNRKSN
jgi:large subunit ribosomal protein L24